MSEAAELDTFINEVEEFKTLFLQSDRRAIKNGNIVTDNDAKQLKEKFNELYLLLNTIINGSNNITEAEKRNLGNIAKKEFLPYMLLTNIGERYYSKPRGYAGDYYTIEMIYQNAPMGVGRLGPLLDECFLNLSAAKAVRNRRQLFSREILRTAQETKSNAVNIMSLACGPSREVIDAFSQLNDKSKLKVTLLDIDEEALAFCKEKVEIEEINDYVALFQENPIHLAIGKRKLTVEKQHFIYTIGLIDYFKDDLVVKLLNYIYELLDKNGRIIVGNFHPANPTKAFMDYVLDWPLIHRTEKDMNKLFEISKFSRPCTNIYFEEENINLFAECIKQ